MDLPRYARQFIDSYYVSEPQRYNMLFAIASSYAEYILEKGRHSGGDLLGFTITDLEVKGVSHIKKNHHRRKYITEWKKDMPFR